MPNPRPVGKGKRPGNPMTRPIAKKPARKPSISPAKAKPKDAVRRPLDRAKPTNAVRRPLLRDKSGPARPASSKARKRGR